MKTTYKITIYFLCLVLCSCVEEVDIEKFIKSNPTGTLVVEGLITNERRAHMVKLSRTDKALPDSTYQAVSGAEVSITDGNQVFSLKEKITGTGLYYTDSIVQGEVGKSYTLTIKENGKIFKATDKMLPVLEFDKTDDIGFASKFPPKGYLYTPLIIYGSVSPAMLSINLDNPGPNAKFTRAYFYTFPGVDSDNIIPKDALEGNISFEEGSKFTQTKYSLSNEHYLFCRALLIETAYEGGIFGSSKANVPTNVSNQAFGFFGASAVISRTFVMGKDGKPQ